MLISRNNAVVSLGVSCQTATQVHAHIKLFSAALGDDELVYESSFFDYLITPLQAATSLFATGDDTVVPQEELKREYRAYWPRHGLYFWHDSFDPPVLQSKYTHQLNKLRKLREVPNLTFVVSNTQSNLHQLHKDVEGLDPTFDLPRVDALMQAVESYYSRECRFVFVSDPALGVLPHAHGRMRCAVVDHPEATWHGHLGAWHLAIRQSLRFYDGIHSVKIRERAPAEPRDLKAAAAEASRDVRQAAANETAVPGQALPTASGANGSRARTLLSGLRARFARQPSRPDHAGSAPQAR